MDRVPTGIYGLDELIEGGFPRGRQILVSGDPGTGKTTFGIQYLVKGIEEYGEPGIYLTFEQNPETVKEDMLRFGWDLDKLEKQGDLIIIDATAPIFGLSSTEEFIITKEEYNVKGVIEKLIQATKEIGAKRLVIDSITDLASRYSEDWQVRKIIHLINLVLHKLKLTSILISELETFSSYKVEEYLADGVIWLRYDDKLRFGRTILIRKMRGTNHSNKIYPYKIEGGKGISIVRDMY